MKPLDGLLFWPLPPIFPVLCVYKHVLCRLYVSPPSLHLQSEPHLRGLCAYHSTTSFIGCVEYGLKEGSVGSGRGHGFAICLVSQSIPKGQAKLSLSHEALPLCLLILSTFPVGLGATLGIARKITERQPRGNGQRLWDMAVRV